MGEMGKVMEDLKPAMMMIMVQVGYAGVSILYKVVGNDEGTSLTILVAYRFIFASLFILPLAFFFERKSKPKITGKVLLQALMCGLFGLEKVNMRRASGKAKVAGALMGIGGAMTLTFYRSTEMHLGSTHFNIMKHVAPHKVSSNQIWGIALACASSLSSSLWLIIQARMSEEFPWAYTSAALMSIVAAIQSLIFALFMERDWKLSWNVFLLTAIYTGIVGSGLSLILITCCVRQKGPLYTSIFSPLFLILVAIAGSFLLDERLHLGSLIGSILITVGLYAVLWGKGKEFKKKADANVKAEDSAELGDSSLKITTTNNDDHQDTHKTTISDDKSDDKMTKPSGFTEANLICPGNNKTTNVVKKGY